MTRLRSRLPFALTLTLLAGPALAGPPVDPTPAPAPAAAGGDRTALDCQIAGRVERFVIAGGALAEGPGTLTVLAEGVYAVSRNGVNYLIDPTGVQIDQGVDAGKWPCVENVAAAPAPAPGPDASQLARIVELEGQITNLQAALNAANGDRDAAVLSRDAALAARDEAQAASAAAASAAQTALSEAAALQARAQGAEARASELETAVATATAAQGAAEARVMELETAATANAAEMAENRVLQRQMAETLAAAEARVAELEAALAAAMATPEEDMAEEDMAEETMTEEDMTEPAEDMTEDHSASEPEPFDADAALLAIDAADLSPISRAALTAAVEQARGNPQFVAEVVTRLQNALGE